MKPVSTYTITAPGFAGLNTSDAPVDLDSKFSSVAHNCVIDRYGRIGARKGWVKITTNVNAELGTGSLTAIGELIQVDGTRTLLAASDTHLFKIVGTTLTTLTYGGGGTAPVLTVGNWQIVELVNIMIFFQRGHDPLIYDPTVSTTTYRRMNEKAGYGGTILKANCALSAWGRVWCADTDTDVMTIKWSGILAPQSWTAGTSGSLNLQSVWPYGGDSVVAMAAHNNKLVIFGTRQTLIYAGADDPDNMVLEDNIEGVGCISRDSVQSTGDDLIFLSASGLRSIRRTIQEKSAPIGNLSINVDADIRAAVANELNPDRIRALYSPTEGFYVVTFVTSNFTYCFNTREPLPNGGLKVTTFAGSGSKPQAYFYSYDGDTYLGVPGGVGRYGGYSDGGLSYKVKWATPWIDFGNLEQTSILKSINATVIGVSNQQVTFKWGFDYVSETKALSKSVPLQPGLGEYNVAEYGEAEYSTGISIVRVSIPASGSGQVVQVGVELDIVEAPISIQQLSIYTKEGRY